MPISKCGGDQPTYISLCFVQWLVQTCVYLCVRVCASCSALHSIMCKHVCVYLCVCLCVCVSCSALLFISIDSIISRYDKAFRRWNLSDLTLYETPSWLNIQISCIYMCLRDVQECLSISLSTMSSINHSTINQSINLRWVMLTIAAALTSDSVARQHPPLLGFLGWRMLTYADVC